MATAKVTYFGRAHIAHDGFLGSRLATHVTGRLDLVCRDQRRSLQTISGAYSRLQLLVDSSSGGNVDRPRAGDQVSTKARLGDLLEVCRREPSMVEAVEGGAQEDKCFGDSPELAK